MRMSWSVVDNFVPSFINQVRQGDGVISLRYWTGWLMVRPMILILKMQHLVWCWWYCHIFRGVWFNEKGWQWWRRFSSMPTVEDLLLVLARAPLVSGSGDWRVWMDEKRASWAGLSKSKLSSPRAHKISHQIWHTKCFIIVSNSICMPIKKFPNFMPGIMYMTIQYYSFFLEIYSVRNADRDAL